MRGKEHFLEPKKPFPYQTAQYYIEYHQTSSLHCHFCPHLDHSIYKLRSFLPLQSALLSVFGSSGTVSRNKTYFLIYFELSHHTTKHICQVSPSMTSFRQ